MEKKGEVEIQFAWLFTAILGGMILLFFIVIALRLSDASEIKISNKLGEKLDTTLRSIGSSSGGGANMSFERDKKVSFECELVDGEVSSKFFIEGARGEHLLSTKVTFSPQEAEDNVLYSFTKEFSPGTKVATFNYFSTPSIIYVFEDEDVFPSNGKPQALYNMMFMKLINKKIIDYGENIDLKSINPYHVNFVTFDSNLYDVCTDSIVNFEDICRKGRLGLTNTQNDILTLIYIETNTAQYNAGRVKIATATDTEIRKVETGFYGKEMALGAVYSGTGEIYACNLKKVLDVWIMQSELLKVRKDLFSTVSSLDGDCFSVYNAITNDNNNGKLDKAMERIGGLLPRHIGYEFLNIYDLLENPANNSVNELNLQLRLGTGRCPLVY